MFNHFESVGNFFNVAKQGSSGPNRSYGWRAIHLTMAYNRSG